MWLSNEVGRVTKGVRLGSFYVTLIRFIHVSLWFRTFITQLKGTSVSTIGLSFYTMGISGGNSCGYLIGGTSGNDYEC